MSAMRTFTSAPARLTREPCGGRQDARGTPRARIGVRSGRIDMGELGRRRRPGRGVTSRRIEVDLTPQAVELLVDQVAQRVVEILRETEGQSAGKPMTAGQLARHLQVERAWVYKHRRLLGGWRINDGPKAQWRFDPDVALDAFRGLAGAPSVGAVA